MLWDLRRHNLWHSKNPHSPSGDPSHPTEANWHFDILHLKSISHSLSVAPSLSQSQYAISGFGSDPNQSCFDTDPDHSSLPAAALHLYVSLTVGVCCQLPASISQLVRVWLRGGCWLWGQEYLFGCVPKQPSHIAGPQTYSSEAMCKHKLHWTDNYSEWKEFKHKSWNRIKTNTYFTYAFYKDFFNLLPLGIHHYPRLKSELSSVLCLFGSQHSSKKGLAVSLHPYSKVNDIYLNLRWQYMLFNNCNAFKNSGNKLRS